MATRKGRKIPVTTTSTLEGSPAQVYLDVVSAHVVAGTGLFSDVFASFSDIFGGRSRSYQRQLSAINSEVIDLLRQKASSMGANAVLGLRLDYSELSGGGKSMFMVTATGTAVKIDTAHASAGVEASPGVLSSEDLQALVRRARLARAAIRGRLKPAMRPGPLCASTKSTKPPPSSWLISRNATT